MTDEAPHPQPGHPVRLRVPRRSIVGIGMRGCGLFLAIFGLLMDVSLLTMTTGDAMSRVYMACFWTVFGALGIYIVACYRNEMEFIVHVDRIERPPALGAGSVRYDAGGHIETAILEAENGRRNLLQVSYVGADGQPAYLLMGGLDVTAETARGLARQLSAVAGVGLVENPGSDPADD